MTGQGKTNGHHRRLHRRSRPDQEGLPVRPGNPLVPGLRRLFHPRADAEDAAQLGPADGEGRLRQWHRLLQPLPLLHEHLWLPQHPRPRSHHRHRPQADPPRPDGLRHHRRRRRAQHRRQPLPPRHAPQRRSQRHPLQQRDLRPDQGAVLAHLRHRHHDQVIAHGLDRGAPQAGPAGSRHRGKLRRPYLRHGPHPPHHHHGASRAAQRRLLRRGATELQHLQRRRLPRLHR